jgi:thymidylate synthase ThyX
MGSDYSEQEKKALANFVTDTEADIYGVKNVPVEVFGAFGSFFSRSPKDMRDNLLDAIKGEVRGYEMDGGDERLQRLADTHDYLQQLDDLDDEEQEQLQPEMHQLLQQSYDEAQDATPATRTPPHKDLESGLEKSQSFFDKYYGTYGHKSIANTVWIPFVANDVSQLFARKLADDQLAFFIEQSTRYVEFDEDSYYKDPDIMDSEHAELYTDTIEQMMENYTDFTEMARDHYESEIPFQDWLDDQPDDIQDKSDSFLERKYDREINAKALDLSRFLMPQAVQTNLAWILDARSTEWDIASWKGHPLQEIQDAAEQIEDAGGDIAPSLLKYTEENNYYTDKLNEYSGDLDIDIDPEEIDKGVELISTPDNTRNKVVSHILHENNPGTFDQMYDEVQEMDLEDKMDILDRVSQDRDTHDEWIGVNEEFDMEKIVAEIRTDIGALRDIRRHQKNDRGENRYTLDMGYERPDELDNMPDEAQQLFDDTMDIAHEAEKEIRQDFPFQAQYVVPMAGMSTITMSLGFDQLQYMLVTRSSPEGNFSYREDMFNLAEEVVKEEPWLLGLEEYPEGEDIQDVYEESDMNEQLLWLHTEDTGLHT